MAIFNSNENIGTGGLDVHLYPNKRLFLNAVSNATDVNIAPLGRWY